ncbi:hypothetical protein [Anabaena sp. CCY 0017]
MTTQPEAELEAALIAQLQAKFGIPPFHLAIASSRCAPRYRL